MGQGLVRSWNDAGWFDLPQRVGDRIAPWIGARRGEVVATDTTSTNLFKVLSAALSIAAKDAPGRRTVLSERSNFPTDLYIAQALCAKRGWTLNLVEAGQVDGVGVLLLTHFNYRTGAMHEKAALTRAAHAAGALAIWDLAHSAGAFPVDACRRSRLRSGLRLQVPKWRAGCPACAWVHPRHADRFAQTLAGWWAMRRRSSSRLNTGRRQALPGTFAARSPS
ncbi:MAG: hypothetical protein NVS2B4_09730 [Ramlibacter sp.]